MNWYKKSQFNDAGAVLYSMLVDAGNNPAKPLSVSSRLNGATPEQIAQAIPFAQSRISQDSNGFLNESQQKLLQEAQGMVNGIAPSQDQNANQQMPQQASEMGNAPAEANPLPQG